MKKKIISIIAAVSVLAGSVCGITSAEEVAQSLTLSPRAQIEIVDGEIRGITGPITAEWLRSQFEGEVRVVRHADKEDITGDTPVPSATYVCTPDDRDGITVTIPGDIKIDGKINLTDASSALKKIAGWDNLSCCDFDAASADLNGDGNVNLSDVSTLLKYIAGWDVNIFDSAPVLTVFDGGATEYKLLANDSAIDAQITSSIKALTGSDIEVVTEVSEGDRFITVGKALYEKYDFIDADAVKALEDTHAYIDTYGGNIYLTARSDNGILGCVNYITNQAFTAELDLNIAKGSAGELGDLETLIRPIRTTVAIKGITETHRLLHVTDSHLITVYDDEETPERRADVYRRINDWSGQYRKASSEYFGEYFNYAGDISAEAVMLTGDMTDSPSKSNRDILEAGINNSPVPAYYMYGNHDWSWNTNAATGDVYHSETFRHSYRSAFAQVADKYDEDWNDYYNVIDNGEYMIVSIDNAWQGFPSRRDIYNGIKAAFDTAKAEGKPIILMLHIPLHNDEMHEAIPHITGNGYCITAENCGNRMIYDMIVAEDSPVELIVAGHVHDNYECMIGDIPQITTGSAYYGWCRVIDLVPAE